LNSAAVLIVEDEPFVALDLALSVEEAGGSVVGPAGTLKEALSLVSGEISGAILDVHLLDGDVSPVLHVLMARGVPVVVQTGGGLPARLKEAYPDLLVLRKPNDASRLVAKLCESMRR
jgi:DNA-binding NtrC family response regulator